MMLISLFAALTITFYLRGVYATTANIGTSFINNMTSSTYSIPNPFGFKVFIGLFVCFAILIFALAFSTWVGLKIMGSWLTYTNVIDQYSSLYVPVVVLIAGSSILTLLTLKFAGMLVLLLALIILSISWYFVIFNAKNKRKLDDFYAKLLALLCGWIIFGAINFILLVFIFSRLVASMSKIF